jgi:hypothetical protein
VAESDDASGPNRPNRLLAGAGIALLIVCAIVAVRGQDELAIGLAVVGVGVLIIAVFEKRIFGEVELSATRMKINVAQMKETVREVGKAARYSPEEIRRAEQSVKEETLESEILPGPSPGESLHESGAPYDDLGVQLPPESRELVDRAETLLAKYEASGDRDDLNKAWLAAKRARQSGPENSVPLLLVEAKIMLRDGVDHDDIENLQSAVHLARWAFDQVSESDPAYGAALGLLVSAVRAYTAVQADAWSPGSVEHALTLLDEARQASG